MEALLEGKEGADFIRAAVVGIPCAFLNPLSIHITSVYTKPQPEVSTRCSSGKAKTGRCVRRIYVVAASQRRDLIMSLHHHGLGYRLIQ